MYRTISKALNTGNKQIFYRIPDNILFEHERKIISFIKQYERQYGELPHISRVAKEFPEFTPFSLDALPPNVLERDIQARLEHFINETIIAVETSNGVDEQINVIKTMLPKLQASPSTLIDIAESIGEYDNEERRIPFLSYKLTKELYGFAKGEYYTFIGQTGVGKSTVVGFAAYQWYMMGYKILWLSLDMQKSKTLLRIHATIAGQNKFKYIKDRKTQAIMAQLLPQQPGRFIVSDDILTTSALEATLDNLKPDIVVVDGVYFMTASGKLTGNTRDWSNVTAVSAALKEMSRRYNVLVIAIDQANSEDLTAFSRAFEQDADAVWVIRGNEDDIFKDHRMLQMQATKMRDLPPFNVSLSVSYTDNMIYVINVE